MLTFDINLKVLYTKSQIYSLIFIPLMYKNTFPSNHNVVSVRRIGYKSEFYAEAIKHAIQMQPSASQKTTSLYLNLTEMWVIDAIT